MWYRILLSVIIIFSITIFQITFLGSFGIYLSNFNLLLSMLVFLLFVINFRSVLFFVIMAGLIMDIFSSLPFGIFLVCFFLSAVISELLLFSFFTNRSFYSVMSLGIITTIIFNILFLVLSGIAYLTGMSEFYIGRGYLLELIYQILNVSIVLFLLFFVVNSFSKAFKPNFISS